MRILSVVGARPQFVKLAPMDRAIRTAGVEHVIVHTGQHYDPMLSDIFFSELGISAPDVHLGVGSGSHGVQTGAMLTQLDGIIAEHAPDWVLVYGDTNSTIAAALSAVKMHVPVAHLEAGLRSFNRRMPEEHNRVLTDHAADLLLAPTQAAMGHLANEGLADRSVLVGDVMTDVLFDTRNKLTRPSSLIDELGLKPRAFQIATIHRAENTDDPSRLREIIDALGRLQHPTVLLAHPRLVARAAEAEIDLKTGTLIPHVPLAYSELIAAALASRHVITDSGGLQKEAFLLRVPCTTIRTETEWGETVDLGWNALAADTRHLAASVSRPEPQPTTAIPYGDGRAADRVISLLQEHAAPQI